MQAKTSPISRKTTKTATTKTTSSITNEKLTSFAWIDGSDTGDVRLSGAWMDWNTIPMNHSPSAPLPIPNSPVSSSTITDSNTIDLDSKDREERDAWTLRTKVPPGMHYFQFVVDGVWTHNPHLPTSQLGAGCNMRMIVEPPDEVGATTVRTEFVWMGK